VSHQHSAFVIVLRWSSGTTQLRQDTTFTEKNQRKVERTLKRFSIDMYKLICTFYKLKQKWARHQCSHL
jgi:hypothetical protein